MLQVSDLTYTIGDFTLLRDVRFTIHSGRRLALIGPNGAGKTTLLRILCGRITDHQARIMHPREYSIGYLPQEEIALEKNTVLNSTLEGHTELLAMEAEMAELHEKIEQNTDHQDKLLQRLGELESQFTIRGGYVLEAETKKILHGLGFSNEDFKRSVTDLSGGWRMRVYLARLLLQKPDLLLLDEPTNHLDLESLEWLESYLRGFSGSMIIVSHDRFFIERLADEILELRNSRLKHYSGSYSFYEKQKKLEEEQLVKKWQEQQEERKRLQQFIDRFRYKASKASQVQSRIKMLEKMESIELPTQRQAISFTIKADTVSYKDVLKIDAMSFRYTQPWVLRELNLQIFRGEKVAMVGVNGAGKTTLTRLISGELTAQSGKIELGQRVRIGYYAQHQIDALDLNKTILDEVAASAAESFQARLRDILGVFQFSGDDVQKRIGVLSGGEKARVSLAKILLSPCNFLIMDEPTNHLDIHSKEALEQALREYDGTLLLISHDRYFLDRLVTRVIELKDGRLRSFEGNYSDYLAHRDQTDPAKVSSAASPDCGSGGRQVGRLKKTRDQKRVEAQARQAVSKERLRLTQAISDIEDKLEQSVERKQKLQEQLADPQTYQEAGLAAELKKEYDQVETTIEELEVQWEESQLKLEEILARLEELASQ